MTRYGHYFKPDQKAIDWIAKYPHRRKDIDNWWDFSYSHNPGWYTNLFEIRPSRRRTKATIRKILKGDIDADEAMFDLAYRPHHYFW